MRANDDLNKKRLHLNRGLVAVGYEVHETRGKTKAARRAIELDDTTIAVLEGWRAYQAAEFAAVGVDPDDEWVFTDGDGEPIHPHAVYEAFRRIVANAGIPAMRFHDLRHTHGSLLIAEGVPVKVVSERLGHAHIAHTLQTYQHVLPRHAGRRGPHRRAPRHAAPDRQEVVGGSSWERPAESGLIRRNTPDNEEGPGH